MEQDREHFHNDVVGESRSTRNDFATPSILELGENASPTLPVGLLRRPLGEDEVEDTLLTRRVLSADGRRRRPAERVEGNSKALHLAQTLVDGTNPASKRAKEETNASRAGGSSSLEEESTSSAAYGESLPYIAAKSVPF